MKNEKLIWWGAIILSFLYIFTAGKRASKGKTIYYQERTTQSVLKCTVTEVLDSEYQDTLYGDYAMGDKVVLFSATVSSGLKKDVQIIAVQYVDMLYGEQPTVSKGDKIVVYKDENAGSVWGADYIFSSFDRTGYLAMLGIIFAFSVLLLGRKKGLNTLISLAFTIIAVFGVFVPAALNGQSIYFWSVSVCIFIILMTIILVNSLSDKSFCAIAGCCGGVVLAGVLTIISDRFLHLTGLATEESMYLVFINPTNPINLKAIIFASIIFGSVGAIMDVAMSMASALKELKLQSPTIERTQIFKSGLSIGQDMMGTMANTLVLAYMGSSLGITLLTMAYNSVGTQLLNSELIVTEILEALAGSIGIVATIPLTALICSILYSE